MDLRSVAATSSEVWAEDRAWIADDLANRMRAGVERIAVFVAVAGDRMVSAAWLVAQPGSRFARLWGGATLPEWRRMGIYRALVAERARLASDWGAAYLQVDASPDSRPILERLGLVAVTTATPYVWTPRDP
jgi:GNAT superfamily N-acetyltransferase